MKLTYPLLMLIFLGVLNAGTVIITGSCKTNLQTGNVLNFTLINTGNDSAYDLVLTPLIFGARPSNLSYSINNLVPNVNISTSVKLINISHQGSYVDAFVLTYQQGAGSAFSAIFPCLIQIGQPAISQVLVNASTMIESNGKATINVSLLNSATEPFNVNVSVLLPPTFSFQSGPSKSVSLSSYSKNSLSFSVEMPSGQSTYTGAVSASYLLNNISYSSFYLFKISTATSSSSGILGSDLPYIVIGIIVIALLILIIRSLLLRNKREEIVQ